MELLYIRFGRNPGRIEEMSQPAKLALTVVAAIVGVYIVLQILGFIVHTIVGIVVPLAILGGIGFVVYHLVTRNSLLGGRRYLP